VFGCVTEGMQVVDAIAASKTGRRAGHDDVPLEPVVVLRASVVDANV
jgi:peptidyl-prolyl cis-trans isomerase B (cyclophilin B)